MTIFSNFNRTNVKVRKKSLILQQNAKKKFKKNYNT